MDKPKFRKNPKTGRLEKLIDGKYTAQEEMGGWKKGSPLRKFGRLVTREPSEEELAKAKSIRDKRKYRKKWTDSPKTGSGAKDIKNKSKVEYDKPEDTRINRWGKTEKVAQPPNFKEGIDASKTLKLGSSGGAKTADKINNAAKKAEDAKTYTKYEKAGKRQSSARNSVARQAYLRKKKNSGLEINKKKTTTPKPEIKKVKPKANGKGPAKVKAGAGGNAVGTWLSFLEQLMNK